MTDFPNFQFASTGSSVQRTMPVRYNDIFNVKDFGAVGDGSTDDSDAIQSTIATAYNTIPHGSGGSVVFFPSGTYFVGRPPLIFGTSFRVKLAANASAGATSWTLDRNYPWIKTDMAVLNPAGGTFRISGFNSSTFVLSFSPTGPNFAVSTGDIGYILVSGNVGDNNIGKGFMVFRGAGRDATVIKGTWNNGNLPYTFDPSYLVYSNAIQLLAPLISKVEHMTIWNQDTSFIGSGAYCDMNTDSGGSWSNCKFIGMAGLNGVVTFGSSVRDCVFICGAAVDANGNFDPTKIGRVDSASPGPKTGTVGVYAMQGECVNCSAYGFDIGFAHASTASTVSYCKAVQCRYGIGIGVVEKQDFGARVTEEPIQNGEIIGNRLYRCQFGIEQRGQGMTAAIVASNCFYGNADSSQSDGLAIPAPIASAMWSAGTVTLTTSSPHGLSGTQNLEIIIRPVTWTPNGVGKQLVLCDPSAGPSTIKYTLVSDPTTGGGGPFSSGTWNAPLFNGIDFAAVQSGAFMANVFNAPHIAGDFLLWHNGTGPGSYTWQWLVSMRAPMGFDLFFSRQTTGNVGNTVPFGMTTFSQCGTFRNTVTGYGAPTPDIVTISIGDPTKTPFNLANQPTFEGFTANITDGQKVGGGIPTFGDAVVGTGSEFANGHMKVRYNGSAFIRIG